MGKDGGLENQKCSTRSQPTTTTTSAKNRRWPKHPSFCSLTARFLSFLSFFLHPLLSSFDMPSGGSYLGWSGAGGLLLLEDIGTAPNAEVIRF